jgi:hypothetical protein
LIAFSQQNRNFLFGIVGADSLAQPLLSVNPTKSKRVKGRKHYRVSSKTNSGRALWGRCSTAKGWRLFRGNGVVRTVNEHKGRAADKRPDGARGSLTGFISGPHATRDSKLSVGSLFQGGRERGQFIFELVAFLV